jgi:hypothetical protein
MTTFENTRELLQAWPGLDDDVRAALLSAVSTRGKWQGFVLANAPASGKRPVAYAAWQALMMELAPSRVSIGGLMFLSDEQKAMFDRMTFALADDHLSLALKAQEPPFRWSMFAHRYDTDKIRAVAFQHCKVRALEAAGQERLFA